jgi:hypothetical protein
VDISGEILQEALKMKHQNTCPAAFEAIPEGTAGEMGTFFRGISLSLLLPSADD